jgi:hypothetical protein
MLHEAMINFLRWIVNQTRAFFCRAAAQFNPTLHAPAPPQSGSGWPRSTLSSSRFTAPLARCYYSLGLYPEWEARLQGLDLVTARDIEKSIRWDAQTYSMSGKGQTAVSAYLAARAAGTLPTDQELEARFAASAPNASPKGGTSNSSSKDRKTNNEPNRQQTKQNQNEKK